MFDLHTHTEFSDGKNTAEEMILAAARRGLTCIGFSDHSFVSGDDSTMRDGDQDRYRAETGRLKSKYAGTIRVLCGLERDYYSDDMSEYDYTIGSVHFLKMPDGHPVTVDWKEEKLAEDVRRYFGGDWYALAEAYYRLEADVVRKTECDIIGHFDVITIFNEGGKHFDESHPRYTAAWKAAADALLKTGKPFEINTGAMSRGYRSEPYPSAAIRDYIREKGGRFVLSSDAHRTEHLAWKFEALSGEAGLIREEEKLWELLRP